MHDYSDWRVIREATATADGQRERYRKNCYTRETEVIPATGAPANPTEPTIPNVPSNPTVPTAPSQPNPPSTPTETKPDTTTPPVAPSQSISAGEQDLPVTVNDGSVNVSMTDDQIENVIADSAGTGVVAIDLTAIPNAAEVTIPQKMIDAIHNSDKEGKPAVSDESRFTDVANGEWYTSAITWASTQNIIGSYGGGLFGPNDNITRERLAVMLWRYAGSPAATSQELRFADASKTSGYALDALRWAVENGILNGKDNNLLDPQGVATRAEVAQMLKNLLG